MNFKCLFLKRMHYSSSLASAEIQSTLISLVKSKDNEGIFYGKVAVGDFLLEPILGPKQNFKLVINGSITSENPTTVLIDYTISKVNLFLLYSIIAISITVFLVSLLWGKHITIGLIPNFEYLILGGGGGIGLIGKIMFESQYNYYSIILLNYLELKSLKDENIVKP